MKHAEKYLCPLCDKQQPAEHFACAAGAKGGRAGTGASKARTAQQASKAGKAGAAKRWANHKKKGTK